MVKLGRTSEIEIDELMRKHAEEMKKLSEKVDSVTNGKKKMEDLLAEVEKKKTEKEEKAKQEDSHEHDSHDHKHVHTLAFTEKGVGKCTGKGCLTEFSLGPVIGENDWDKEMPDPSRYAESGFDEKKVHNVYECATCNSKLIGPKRKDVGVENKLTDCPFCKDPKAMFQPVDLRKLKDKIKKR
jgi:hypothetical protein